MYCTGEEKENRTALGLHLHVSNLLLLTQYRPRLCFVLNRYATSTEYTKDGGEGNTHSLYTTTQHHAPRRPISGGAAAHDAHCRVRVDIWYLTSSTTPEEAIKHHTQNHR